MAGWFARFVDSLPERPWFGLLSKYIVVPYWARREPKAKLPGGPRPSIQPSDNVQRMMNLIMPLKDPSPVGRARTALAIAANVDEIFGGLDNVGTVHFARFLLLDDYLCMISVYDGDFSNYIRDFIVTVGSVFDAIMTEVKGGDAMIPTQEHVETFIDWVHDHDLFQVPDFPTGLFGLQDIANPDGPQSPHPLDQLPRDMILQLKANPNISLGGGYRAYAGFSAAQVRDKLGVGW